MANNPFNDPVFGIMYQDALCSLNNGTLLPEDLEVLALAPLPQDVVDPFVSQDVDPNEVMRYTYNALTGWIEEAKKANYFSVYFVKMSKLVMKGVITMSRGLVTLHNRGEETDHAPMSIGDLISLSSYHFRKSYLGVVQCAKSHPEISERLLLNQMTWSNMLLRLYKTKEKLEQKVPSVSRQKSENVLPECGQDAVREICDPETGNQDSGKILPAGNERPFSDVSEIFEPGVFSSMRPFTSLDRKQERGTGSASRSAGQKKQESGIAGSRDSNDETIPAENETSMSGKMKKTEKEKSEKEADEMTENKTREGFQASADRKLNQAASQFDPADPSPRICPASEEQISEQFQGDKDEDQKSPAPAAKTHEKTEHLPQTGKKPEIQRDISAVEFQDTVNNKCDSGKAPPGSDGFSDIIFSGNREKEGLCMEESPSDTANSDVHFVYDPDLPLYLAILKRAFCQSDDGGKTLSFSREELCYLTEDPEFIRLYPDSAAKFRGMIQDEEIVSGGTG